MSWCAEDEGVSANKHSKYLRQFCDWFYSSVVKQVEGAVKQRQSLVQDELVTEAMQVRVCDVIDYAWQPSDVIVMYFQHLKMARERCEIFQGREELLDKLKTILLKDSRKPVVVYGSSGCGKTSIMAVTSKNV